jgi:hypothetical protein
VSFPLDGKQPDSLHVVAVPLFSGESQLKTMATVVNDAASANMPSPLPDVPVHVDTRPDIDAESETEDSDFVDEEAIEDILAADVDNWQYGEGEFVMVFFWC